MAFLPHPIIRLPSPKPSAEPTANAPKQILFFGNIKHYKGVDILVQAGLQLAKKQKNFHITIAGKPFMELEDIYQQISQADAGELFTIIPRYLSEQELANTLSASDIIVFPYREIDASGAFSLRYSIWQTHYCNGHRHIQRRTGVQSCVTYSA